VLQPADMVGSKQQWKCNISNSPTNLSKLVALGLRTHM
jgi:hypothetical protein